MIRCRFYANKDDWRPVKWPIKHPCWCTGYSDEHSIIVAYADNEEEILRNWPEAVKLDSTEVTEYKFSERFPRPEWLKERNNFGG